MLNSPPSLQGREGRRRVWEGVWGYNLHFVTKTSVAEIPLAAVSNQSNKAASNSLGERTAGKFESLLPSGCWNRKEIGLLHLVSFCQPPPSGKTAKLNKNHL